MWLVTEMGVRLRMTGHSPAHDPETRVFLPDQGPQRSRQPKL